MRSRFDIVGGLITSSLLGVVSVSQAALLPGLGEVSGTVSGPKSEVVPVYLYNEAKHVGYAVFAVNGSYRAVDVFPGHYEITVQHYYMPSPVGLEMEPVPVDVKAGGHSVANLSPKPVAPAQDYVEGFAYTKGILVKTYDEIYPQGPGRKILEHACIVCHGVNFIPGKSLDRVGWEALINLMIKPAEEGGANGRFGMFSGPPLVSPDRLSAADIPVLLDYLAANFGPDSEPRAVRQEVWPSLDPAALAKAQYIEYRMPTPPGTKRHSAAWSMNLAPNGSVYISDFGGGMIWQLDPTTGESKSCATPGGESTHNMVVDGDGTVWAAALGPPGQYGMGSALLHMDPKTCMADRYKFPQTGAWGHTPVLAPNGDVWVTLLALNALGHYDRATDRITYYLDPVSDAAPYGLDIDHEGRVWFAEYWGGAITRFDPATKTFKRYVLQTWPNNLRRLDADSKDNMWFATWGYMGKYGFLGRIDRKTGGMTEFTIPIEYGHPYDVRPDAEDNIWVAQDNYLAKFDRKTLSFTIYPMPERTDEIKLEVTLDGAVWTAPRGAGGSGYGAAATAFYPDKDAIRTLRALPNPKLSNDYAARYHGAFSKITGVVKWQQEGAQNQVDYQDVPKGLPIGPNDAVPQGLAPGPTTAPE